MTDHMVRLNIVHTRLTLSPRPVDHLDTQVETRSRMITLIIPDQHKQLKAVMVGIDLPTPVPLLKWSLEHRMEQPTKQEGVLVWPAYNLHLPDRIIHDHDHPYLLRRRMLEQ